MAGINLAGVLLLAAVGMLASIGSVSGEACVMSESPCKCAVPDGRTLDITNLSREKSFQNIPAGAYVYTYGPCGDVLDKGDTCTPHNNAAVCQLQDDGFFKHWNMLGQSTELSVDVDTSANPTTSTWTYSGGDMMRTAIVNIECDPDETPGEIAFQGENPMLHYHFVVKSSYGCLSGAGPTDPPPPHVITGHGGGGGSLPSWINLVATLAVIVPLLVIIIGLLILILQRLGLYKKSDEYGYHKLSFESDPE